MLHRINSQVQICLTRDSAGWVSNLDHQDLEVKVNPTSTSPGGMLSPAKFKARVSGKALDPKGSPGVEPRSCQWLRSKSTSTSNNKSHPTSGEFDSECTSELGPDSDK